MTHVFWCHRIFWSGLVDLLKMIQPAFLMFFSIPSKHRQKSGTLVLTMHNLYALLSYSSRAIERVRDSWNIYILAAVVCYNHAILSTLFSCPSIVLHSKKQRPPGQTSLRSFSNVPQVIFPVWIGQIGGNNFGVRSLSMESHSLKFRTLYYGYTHGG